MLLSDEILTPPMSALLPVVWVSTMDTPLLVVQVGQVTIVAPLNVPSLLGEHASELYAKNQLNLLELFVKDGALKLDWSDEVLAKTVLTHGGEIKNEAAKKAVEG